MPQLSRQPNGTIEERIDYDRVAGAQARRHRDTIAELRAVLRRVESRTLRWASIEIVRNKRKTAIAKYTMPLFMKYREILRRKMLSANRRGRSDAMGELGLSTPQIRQPVMSRTRARADALAREHRDRLEADMRRELGKAAEGTVSADVIAYTVRKVFADFAGWEQPESP